MFAENVRVRRLRSVSALGTSRLSFNAIGMGGESGGWLDARSDGRRRRATATIKFPRPCGRTVFFCIIHNGMCSLGLSTISARTGGVITGGGQNGVFV